MPQFADFVRYSVVAARAAANGNNDNNNARPNRPDDNPPNHRSVEIGVIVAIIVAGLAIIGGLATYLYKRRQRMQKRAAKREASRADQEIEWYGPRDAAPKGDVGMQESGVQSVAKCVGVGGEEELAPPSYQVVVGSQEKGVAR